ncbi:MAG: hypothetical protein ACI4TY_02545 [Candidatus Limosilactobacillus intestinavium]
MNKKQELKAIMEHPEYMLIAESKTLKQRIASKRVEKEDVKKAMALTAKNTGKSLASDVLNGKWFDLVYDVMDTGDKLKSKLDDAKKLQLLGECLQKSDNHEKMLNNLVDLITNPYGLTLYLKIVDLLSETPADGDILDILSDYLSNLTKENNLKRVFSKNKTILRLIDKCSPQALVLLKRADEWPEVKGVKVLEINNGFVQGDNSRPIAKSFVESKQFNSISIDDMQMAIIDLDINGLAKLAHGTLMSNPPREITVEKLTDLGKVVREAIMKK